MISDHQSGLNVHLISEHEGTKKVYKCELCQKQFVCVASLNTHKRTIHEKHEFVKCDICDAKLKSYYLPIHKKKRHSFEKETILCDVCELGFQNIFQLKSHYRVHKDKSLQKVTCELCGKFLANKDDMSRHLRSYHVQEKAHKCSKCEGFFKSKESLRIHVRDRHEYVLQKCESCDKRFKNLFALKKHVARIHEKSLTKSFECNVCGTKFTDKGNLFGHIRNVHNGIKSKCNLCGRTFKSLRYLQIRGVNERKFSWLQPFRANFRAVIEPSKFRAKNL